MYDFRGFHRCIIILEILFPVSIDCFHVQVRSRRDPDLGWTFCAPFFELPLLTPLVLLLFLTHMSHTRPMV